MRPHGTPKQLEDRRRRAVELLKTLNPLDAAQKIGCSLSSVYMWQQICQEQGKGGLKAKEPAGRPAKLNQQQKINLGNVLLQGALKSGYATDLWTTRRIAEVIDRRFGIEYHPNHIGRLLAGMGWSCQKPEKAARQKDQKSVEHWKRYQWPHIKKRSKARSPVGISRRKRLSAGAAGA